MKKVVAVVLAVMFLSMAAACESSSPEQSVSSSTISSVPSSAISSNVESLEDSMSGLSSSEESGEVFSDVEEDAFSTFASGLNSLGIEYTEDYVEASMVGAEEGIRYKTESGNIELYVFPESAEALQTGTITFEPFGEFPIEVNGNLGLFIEDIPEKEKIISLFEGL